MGGRAGQSPPHGLSGDQPGRPLGLGLPAQMDICHVRKFYLSISYDVVSGPGDHTQFQTTRRQVSWEMLLISRGGGPKLSPGKGGRLGAWCCGPLLGGAGS